MLKQESDLYPYSVTDISQKDALIIAPHPDDESLGCGGSIAKHIKAGSRVKVIFLTDGDKGDFEKRFGDDYVKIRRLSARKAMEILGVKNYEFWGYVDRELHSVENEIKDRLIKVTETFLPSLIYAPSLFEAHPDHRSSFKAVWELREKSGITVVLYEVLMALYPNILVDISDEIEQKKMAIECYYTEVYYNDYVTKIEGLNRFRTATLAKSVKYTEGFIMIEKDFSPEALPYKLLLTALS
jgi:LmbE family N-acetylglucosaminyl deacetylase